MQTPHELRSLRRHSRRTQLLRAPNHHATLLDIAMMFHHKTVEEAFDGSIGNGELLIGTQNCLVATRVVSLAGRSEGSLLAEDYVD